MNWISLAFRRPICPCFFVSARPNPRAVALNSVPDASLCIQDGGVDGGGNEMQF